MSINKVIFNYTGTDQTFVVPPFVESILIKAWGAGGGQSAGSSTGGPGGYSNGNLAVTPGQSVTIVVGQGGKPASPVPTYGGGGPGGMDQSPSQLHGASGGGRSAVRLNDGTEVLTAGGGGGSAGATGLITWSNGGSGGGLLGTNGWINPPGWQPAPGSGGSQVAGGLGGTNILTPNPGDGIAGVQYQGGSGGMCLIPGAGGGGGGGGGYFGGGGGAGQWLITPAPTDEDAAGGGGSSFIGGVTAAITLSTPQNTVQVFGPNPFLFPPNTLDPDYIVGVGDGAFVPNSSGGNGLVVIIYIVPDLTLNKTVDKDYSDTNSDLTYTISVNNSGPVTLTNVVFVDTIPNGTTLLANSLTVDSIPDPGNPNPPGITIPSIGIGATSTVQFKINIGVTIPSPNPIIDIATAGFAGGSVFNSNSVTTTISNATVTASKEVDKQYADIGYILTYTIPLIITGNTSATNVLLIDTIPNGTTLVSGSFKVNGTATGQDPNPPGANLGTIPAGTLTTITFQVQVETIPSPNPIPNSANVSYNYTIDPCLPDGALGSTNTTIVNTQVNNVTVTSDKEVDKQYADIGHLLTYTIPLIITGNTSATNVLLIDTIPNGTTLVSGSFKVNGTATGQNPNPPGADLGTIPAGTLTTITFQVQVETIPSPNPIPNSANISYKYTIDPCLPDGALGSTNTTIVNTQVNSVTITASKEVDKQYANVGDILTYTIPLSITGNTSATNVLLIDTIPNGTTLVSGSFKVDGTATGQDPNSPGANLGTIPAGTLTTITFQVQVETIPSPNPIPNSANLSYNYTIDPDQINGAIGSVNTTIVNTQINNANLVNISMNVNRSYATCGDELTYLITIPNTGNTTAFNVVLVDTVPNGASFVPGSVYVNGLTTIGNPNTGISVGSIPAGSSSTVSFKLQINC